MCVFTPLKAGWFARVEIVVVEVVVAEENTQRKKANHPDPIGMILFALVSCLERWGEGRVV